MTTVIFRLTGRLAEVVGFESFSVEIEEGATLRDAVSHLERHLATGPGAVFVEEGVLHPAILVVAKGQACRGSEQEAIPLSTGDEIGLILPVAGG